MYESFYNLKELPFQITPDSRFFFGQGPHKKALAYASYGLSKGEGFVVITGEIGAGKTTLVNYFLTRLVNANRTTARIVSSRLEDENLLRVVGTEFGIECENDDKANLLRKIQAFLSERADNASCGLLIVDEVQNLTAASLEELRMLSNYQRHDGALLQIFLVGQPEFRDTLRQPEMEQLRQRVVASFHLSGLDQSQTREYIEHRLHMVDWNDDPKFHPFAFQEIFRASDGIPRRINLICDRLLVSGFLAKSHEIALEDVTEVVSEMRKEGLLVDPEEEETPAPAPVTEIQPAVVQQPQPVIAPTPLQPPPPSPPSNSDIPDDGLAESLESISQRLQEIDQQMREQERRLDQILTDGQLTVSTVSTLGKG